MLSDAEFIRQCRRAGETIITELSNYSDSVSICTVIGVAASIMKARGISLHMAVAMLDDALNQLESGDEQASADQSPSKTH